MFVEKKKKSEKTELTKAERLERRRIYSSSVEKSFSSWSIYGEIDIRTRERNCLILRKP